MSWAWIWTLLGAATPAVALGQTYRWRAIDMHIDGPLQSEAHAVHVDVVASVGDISLRDRNTGALLADLLPAGWSSGSPEATRGQLQAGYVSGSNEGSAIVWAGSAEDHVLFDPGQYDPDYWLSAIYDMSDSDFVGYAVGAPDYEKHAMRWLDDPSQFTDLHPAGALTSRAYATDGTLQGGVAMVRVNNVWLSHAALWSGTPESFVDMNPPGAQQSYIEDMAPGVQVGWALMLADLDNHAILWRGTPSWEDLSPTGSHQSYLFGTTGTRHVGRASFGGGFAEAGIWMSDDPDSYHHLEQYLPPEYAGSNANAVHEEGSTIYVVGRATYSTRPHAILWIGTRVDPGGDGAQKQPGSVERRP